RSGLNRYVHVAAICISLRDTDAREADNCEGGAFPGAGPGLIRASCLTQPAWRRAGWDKQRNKIGHSHLTIEISLKRTIESRPDLPILWAAHRNRDETFIIQVVDVVRSLTIIDPIPESRYAVLGRSNIEQSKTTSSIEGVQ